MTVAAIIILNVSDGTLVRKISSRVKKNFEFQKHGFQKNKLKMSARITFLFFELERSYFQEKIHQPTEFCG